MAWVHAIGVLVLAAMAAPVLPVGHAGGEEREQVALETATIFRAARKVISDNQALINDAGKGDKGLTGAKVVEETKANYKAATGKAWQDAEAGTLQRAVQDAMVETIGEVMTQAQPLINESGKGFKGFLPAVFAKQLADGVSKRLDGRLFIKLTAPKAYVRNRANRPDTWENDVIEQKFKAKDWQKGKSWSEVGQHKSRQGLRLMVPEYYGKSCLDCHGNPKGERDITGGLKEGGVLDEVGGAISVVVYDTTPGAAPAGK